VRPPYAIGGRRRSSRLTLNRLFETGAHSDFEVVCDRDVHYVHKAVLFMHSDGLWKMSSNEAFKVRRACSSI